jgi:alanyl-tRNA synthetase
MPTGNDIRQKFLDFFAKNQHTVLPSSALVPRNDPSLMFTNSGMVQFKNYFTGAETSQYPRVVTAQKCVRAGGKHNDLENVGYTARHHTFFEMLGNFSFGDYFKEQAIEHAWNLITREYGVDKNRLCVTVFHEDEEAAGYWKKIAGLSDNKIIRIDTADNFWSMGDTGPCGPCSEIFYDHGDKIPGGPPGSVDADGDRFVEIWNLVFMQFEQVDKTTRLKLPKPSIDTGMGLERLTAVLQGVHNNYDTDLLRDLVDASAQASGKAALGKELVSHRVIADHLRSSAFLMADGVLPSNEGRGYVLRRIMRRAMRHAHLLGCAEPLLYRLVPALVKLMGGAYGELLRAQPLITETLRIEEERFQTTLGKGLKLLDDELAKIGATDALPGAAAFKLYDTFGFPLDLTQDVLRGLGRSVDLPGFDAAMAKQKADARKAWAGSGETGVEKIWFELRDELGASEFLGYDTDHASAHVTAIIADGKRVEKIASGQAWVICNQTPFYAESGGQVGDAGAIKLSGGKTLTVLDTQKKAGDVFAHWVEITHNLQLGDAVQLQIDTARRAAIQSHHSVTHLLHAALRAELGDHVGQKGSLNAPERLRFDISHPKPMTDAEIQTIEREVNARIAGNTPVTTRLLPKDEAIALGAMAMFGEKYADTVRVVAMGGVDGGSGKEYSIELCGGTHVRRTGDIGLFRIVGESAVAAGVRRIEAVAGQAALSLTQHERGLLESMAQHLKIGVADLPGRVAQLADDRKKLERELAELKRHVASGGGGNAVGLDVKTISGIQFSAKHVPGIPARDLKSIADTIRGKIGSGVIVVASSEEDRASLVVSVTADLTGRVSAVDLIRLATPILGGQGGGGRADMAQGGGPDIGKIDDAFLAIEQAVARFAA